MDRLSRICSRIRLAAGLCGFVWALALGGCRPETPADVPPVPAPEEGGWRLHVAEASADHPAEAMLTLEASAPSEGRERRPRLVLGCLDEETSAYVEWARELGAGEVPVMYRVDGEPVQAARWQTSGDREAAGLWTDSASVPFIRSLLGRDTLAARAAPEGGLPLDATFLLAGLDSLVTELQRLCAWS